jgi:hypothetical protein
VRKPESQPFSSIENSKRIERGSNAIEAAKSKSLNNEGVSFDDDFAPSSSQIRELGNTGILTEKPSRLLCYNDHVIDYMEGALERACELGLPRIFWGFPLVYPELTEARYEAILPVIGLLCEGLEEHGDDWLALKCYLCWLTACRTPHDSGNSLLVAESMFVAGATAREFELSVRNRAHSAIGRKQSKHLTGLRETKNRRAATKVANRRDIILTLLATTRLKGGALEKFLIQKLEAAHNISVKKRTVRADLKAIRG